MTVSAEKFAVDPDGVAASAPTASVPPVAVAGPPASPLTTVTRRPREQP